MRTDPTQTIDIESLIRRPFPIESRHLNLRLSGVDLRAYQHLKVPFPEITDSLRIRDCVRIAAFLFAMRDKGKSVKIQINGSEKDLLDHVGAFAPQTPMDTRKRKPRA